MTAKISSSEVSEDILLADDDEEQAGVAENEEDDVKSVTTNLSKSLQIMAGSIQAMEVSLKRLHSIPRPQTRRFRQRGDGNTLLV